jgi:hypothetical protein
MARFYQDAQAAAPGIPAGLTDANGAPIGLLLADMAGFRLAVQCTTPSTTLDGTGTFRCVLWHPTLAAWLRNPDLDLAVGATVAGQRGRVFSDIQTVVADGARVYFYRDTVGVSVVGDITVRLDCIPVRP